MKRVKVGPHLFMGTETIGGVPFAWIELPSGRKIFYAHASLNDESEVEFFGRNVYKGGAWEFVSTYGGKLTENIVQATSRDLLAFAMLELEKAGFRIVMTVHDELVVEDSPERLKEFEKVMSTAPAWARGLPLGVEVFHSHRYRK
jgi:DNA polymerase